ncbi:glycerol-3-phosphate 1-O-acyltransferase PlsY [Anaerotignum propionicum]|uniref:glycerol-3-phosphate 1-O-acyltransferase PlsY n=1 Tax=Anaerotignum propionicum TaxID=28446 RepID=UPI00210D35D6|nr:glycerol-3-phosphate 1-O-acyltransferase PlsY [Anaerotignum propionicum]MCQ4936229.1 glycerol-3-phosphate 1-O-acyltransferase PlsY [Anaerotignum propionicum]
MFRLISLLIGYFIGCISMGFIVGKLTKTDLRKKGSGNLGTTNALRVLGFRAGLATFLGDILKGVVAFFLCRLIFPDDSLLAGIYAGAGAILGHDFPFYLKFKGGKGIASTIGIVLSLTFVFSPFLGAITIAIGILGVACSGFISMGSILFSISIPISAYFLGMPTEAVAIFTALAVLATWLHRANIKRLISGTENKFTLHKNVQ